ncbi:hypothetical protein LJC60_03415 [Ruminococcaceae bacterium OttesenSCG-928-D13]|nr:hypothetical protein [Ruminococcaceae bacterium OttesenSCG-928-D13]
MKNQEIERKWMTEGFPDLPFESEELQTQGYLAFDPVTVRIRKVEWPGTDRPAARFITVKGGGTLARTEVELPMDQGQFDALWPLLAAPGATKRLRRYKLPDGRELECSHVDETEPTAFFYAEVEFDSLAEAEAFDPPAGLSLGREVTDEPGQSMSAYCRAKGAES